MSNEINFEVHKYEGNEDRVKQLIKHCWNKDSKASKARMFASNDSILELYEYWLTGTIPRSVAAQLRTHEKKHGVYFWMGTARPDREDAVPGDYSRSQLVPFAMKLTARAIKEISHYRMCSKAEKPTRDFMKMLKHKLMEIEPDLADQMMPLCMYRGGICTEFNSCKRNKGGCMKIKFAFELGDEYHVDIYRYPEGFSYEDVEDAMSRYLESPDASDDAKETIETVLNSFDIGWCYERYHTMVLS